MTERILAIMAQVDRLRAEVLRQMDAIDLLHARLERLNVRVLH